MRKVFGSCFLALILLIGCLCPLSVSAYSAVTSTYRQPLNPFSVTSDVDGLVVLNMFFFSQSDTSVINSPEKLAEVSFKDDGIWNGSDISLLSSTSLYGQSNIGYSISEVYNPDSTYFVYRLLLSIPVSAGDSFYISVAPSSLLYTSGNVVRMFTIPGASALRRVYRSTSDPLYTLQSDNQHFVFTYFAHDVKNKFVFDRTNWGNLADVAAGSTNLDFVSAGIAGSSALFTTPYGLASGSDIAVQFTENGMNAGVPFDFSVYECLTGVDQTGGSMDDTGDSGGSSGGSGFDDSNIISAIKNIPDKVGAFFKTALDNAVTAIGNFIKDLFLPDPEIIKKEVEFIQDKFSWFEVVVTLVTGVVDKIKEMDGTVPGVIYLNITSNDSMTLGSISGKMVALDFSWFADYRGTVHTILAAFLWFMYLWRLLHMLPGIINGAAGAVGSAMSTPSPSRPVTDFERTSREADQMIRSSENYSVSDMANMWADYYDRHPDRRWDG